MAKIPTTNGGNLDLRTSLIIVSDFGNFDFFKRA